MEHFNIETAIPLGLIINELVINALNMPLQVKTKG
jgi:two-component sensor histidine kinase